MSQLKGTKKKGTIIKGNFRKENQKKVLSTILGAALTVGVMTLTFQGLSQTAFAKEVDKTEVVQTSYPQIPVADQKANTVAQPENKVNPAYTLTDSDLDYYKDQKPSASDLSREEAAEYGVMALQKVFGLDMTGKTIEMAYNAPQNGYRGSWEGTWWVDGKKTGTQEYVKSYSFSVDSISGEVHNVINSRVLSADHEGGFNKALQNDSDDYASLAKDLAGQLNILNSPVASVEYDGQGMTNNDPDIFFIVTGENGTRAQLMFSRYDKALLAVTYPAGMKDMDIAIKNAEEFSKRAEEYFRQNPDATTYEE